MTAFPILRRALAVLLLLPPLAAQDFHALPDWARPHAQAAAAEPAPPEADAWVLFDRTEFAYTGDGTIQTRRQRLVRILTDRGRSEAIFRLIGVGGGASKVNRLKGWNLRPDGEVTRVDRDLVLSFQDFGTPDVRTATMLQQVTKGSLVAFESLQTERHPMGPTDGAYILETHPIRRWELEPAKRDGWFTNTRNVEIRVDRHHFSPWFPQPGALGEIGIGLDRVPALPKDENHTPHARNVLPWVSIRFIDPDLKDAPVWTDWDAFARWEYGKFKALLAVDGVPEFKGKDPADRLGQLHAWMAKELTYKAVYLTPERGWVPLAASEVGRRHYGDCKDLTSFLIAGADRIGLEACPVLALILEGEVEAGEPLSLMAHNHVITAIRLDASLGFPAEVETPEGRFLLVDPTDRFTSLGRLDQVHRGRRLLICTAKGGQWVRVPDAAIVPPKVTLRLKGEADARGNLHATLAITEQGDAWKLRAIAQMANADALRADLQKRLDLPPMAVIQVLAKGDPLDQASPFTLNLALDLPQALKRTGGELELTPLGWQIVPVQTQKPGVPRRLPVSQGNPLDLEYFAEITTPTRCAPVLPAKEGDTPFRSFSWTAQAADSGAGTRLSLHLQHHMKHVGFDFEHREEGVAASKKDRSQALNLLADALAFKVLP